MLFRTWGLGLVCGLFVLPAAASAGPLLYYNFESPDTTSDNLATDVSGNGRNGTLSANGTGTYAYETSVPTALAGKSAQSLHLSEIDASNAAKLTRFVPTSELNFSTHDWSYVGWFKVDGSTTTDNETIFHVGTGDLFGGEDEIYVNASGSSIALQHYPGPDVNISKGATITAWHHVAVTYSNSAATVQLYVDGTLAGSDNAFTLNMIQASSNANVGFGGFDATTRDRYLNGWMDDVAVYDSTLTAADVSGLASGNLTPTDVPEPSTAALCVIVAGGALLRRRSVRRV
jgi:hypothetical protein